MPDERSLFYLRLSTALLAGGVSAVLIIIVKSVLFAVLTVTAVISAAVFFFLYYIPCFFRNLEYTTDSAEIVKTSGVIFTQKTRVRFKSVQSLSVVTVPFSGRTGFNCVILYFYGGRILLPFLKRSDAEEIVRCCLEGQ